MVSKKTILLTPLTHKLKQMLNPYKTAQQQILNVYDYLKKEKISKEFIEEFLYPDRVIEVNIPVKMDN